MHVYTIGFTQKTAEEFFALLRRPGLKRVIDIRLNNASQLAAFTKKQDLPFFLREICDLDYVHLAELAPNKEILDHYKKNGGDWAAYETAFLKLLADRRVEKTLDKDLMDGGCLLCSEPTPEQCHRRLVAEYLAAHWEGVAITHL